MTDTSAFFYVIGAWIIVFWGEPDIVDALIHILMK
jgi:hypothetical protein